MNKEETAQYARGYAAGRKRLDRDLAHEDLTKREVEVWQKIYGGFVRICADTKHIPSTRE